MLFRLEEHGYLFQLIAASLYTKGLSLLSYFLSPSFPPSHSSFWPFSLPVYVCIYLCLNVWVFNSFIDRISFCRSAWLRTYYVVQASLRLRLILLPHSLEC